MAACMMVALLVNAQLSLSPTLMRCYVEMTPQQRDDAGFAPVRMMGNVPMADAFIAYSNEGVLQQLQAAGVVITCPFQGFVTARIPLDKLEQVAQWPGVIDVELSTMLQLCTDSTLSVTHAGEVINGTGAGLPSAFDGTGVIVAVIDHGFDFKHRAFMRSDDATVSRITRIYLTQDTCGHKARYEGTTLPGSVYMGDEIASLTCDDTGTHGTHTASIAAGTHVNGYGGMAPGAEIVLCGVSSLGGSMSTTELANTVRYIASYADSVGKPCVVSLSMSTNNGPHDGNDYLSQAIKKFTGSGRVFVIAAGNTASNFFYDYGLATTSKPVNMLVKCNKSSDADSCYYYNCWIDTWFRTPKVKPAYRFHIIDVNTHEVVWQSAEYTSLKRIYSTDFSDYYEPDSTVSETGYLFANMSYSAYSKRYEIRFYFTNLRSKSWTVNSSGKKVSNYALGVSVRPKSGADSCWIDSWIGVSDAQFAWLGDVTTADGELVHDFYLAPSDSCSIGTYAASDSVISAGAFVGRNSYYSLNNGRVMTDNSFTVGDVAMFSSYQPAGMGPTGVQLPTVCAPGVLVVAAASRYSYLASTTHQHTVMHTDDGSYWGVMTGTSMASPTVAGIIAQWLQVNPNLSPSDIKGIIASTAIHDQFTDGEHSARFGAGKIDALAGIKQVIANMGVILGDVNGDGAVDIIDLTTLIDYVLGSKPSPFVVAAADINQDGLVNINDVTLLIDIILKS